MKAQELEHTPEEIRTVLRVAEQARVRIKKLTKLMKGTKKSQLSHHLLAAAKHLAKDWQTVIKHQRRQTLRHIILNCGQTLDAPTKQLFVLDSDLATLLGEKDNPMRSNKFTMHPPKGRKARADQSAKHFQKFT